MPQPWPPAPIPRGPSTALNLADVAGTATLAHDPRGPQAVLDDILAHTCAQSGFAAFGRVYAGSYFCDRFFLALDDAFFAEVGRFARRHGMRATLVLPIFGQATWARGSARVEELLSPGTDGAPCSFDEVVVNDPACAERTGTLLDRIGRMDAATASRAHPRLVLGRLMAKSARDPRYENPHDVRPCPLDARQASVARAAWHPALMELDPFAPVIDASPLEDALPVALHLPHSAMSTGHICEAAATARPAGRKFRPGAPCRRECLCGIDVYETGHFATGEAVYLTRQGRTVFFENPGCRVVGAPVARVIWAPDDFLCPLAPEGVPTERVRIADAEGGSAWEPF